MQRRYNLAYLILASIVVLMLTPLMICVEAHAQIAFMSKRDGNPEIYVMDADGENPRNLTNNRDNDWWPSWSPDGKRIVFVSERDGNREVYVMDADGENPRNLTNNPNEDWYPSWSLDGKRIAFMSLRDGHIIDGRPTFEIYVMDVDGGNPQNLTNDRNDDRYPSWSPDSQHIVFVSQRPGHFKSKFLITYEIYVMDADGQNEQRLTENRQNDFYPSWSPDGERIAFESDRKGDFENPEIYVMDADGGNQQKLTENRRSDLQPAWSPDSKRIAFVSWRDGNSEIYVMDADGKNPQRLTNNPHDDVSPAWLNSPFSVSPAGKKFTMWGWLKQVD